ncbi:hypothetical protein Acsp03_20130 [Actinomadura sp. NBRC 104412]|nr:hypothetical protein Acsp03_20130 [Actinomadura sp. NBRC 104412]
MPGNTQPEAIYEDCYFHPATARRKAETEQTPTDPGHGHAPPTRRIHPTPKDARSRPFHTPIRPIGQNLTEARGEAPTGVQGAEPPAGVVGAEPLPGVSGHRREPPGERRGSLAPHRGVWGVAPPTYVTAYTSSSM